MSNRILILTMSCNIPYFQALLGAVKDTWAKPLMQNKYKNIVWFAYTSCDKRHPKPCIDFEDHMIYVDCPDDLKKTYTKTQLAYNMVKESGFEFDYVIRTNTSIFLNIEKVLERLDETGYDNNNIMARANGFQYSYPDGRVVDRGYIFIGYFMGMNKKLFDLGMSADETYLKSEEGIVIPTHDDVIFSLKILDSTNINNIGFTEDDVCPAYKCFNLKDEQKPDNLKFLPQKDLFFEPHIVNDYPVIRIRTMYNGDERITKGHEIEHMYELYNELR